MKADVFMMTEGSRPDYDTASSQGTTGVEERGMWSKG